MTEVRFEAVTKRFGATLALDRFELTVHAGELLCLLGPSGCGKTTALRMLAGFEHPDQGDVTVAGRSVLNIAAARRGFGMVFQSYSLFPNMSAARNIGFALQVRRVRGHAQQLRVAALLELTGLTQHAGKYPHQLSGGQQQRVALARALALEPPVLLLDEPLSALDAAVREQLRDEIRRLQRELGITTLFVTHDQHEAMAVADRIGVMASGRLIQVGPPAEVYLAPADRFVSTFLGTSNHLPVERLADGTRVVLGSPLPDDSDGAAEVQVRPEHIRLAPFRGVSGDGSSPSPHAEVSSVSFLGPLTRVTCTLAGTPVVVDVPSHDAIGLLPGHLVRLSLAGPMAALALR